MTDTQKQLGHNGKKGPYMLVHRHQGLDTPLGLINLDTATEEDIIKFAEWVKGVLLRRFRGRSYGQSSTGKDVPIDPQCICQCGSW